MALKWDHPDDGHSTRKGDRGDSVPARSGWSSGILGDTNFAISLTPIAAEYRAGLGISYLPMLGEALLGGLIIGFGVSYSLLRLYGRLPTSSPLLKAVLLSLVALIVATVLVEIPPRLLATTSTDLRYFLIGAAFNTLRFGALGVVIGYLYGRTADPQPATARKPNSQKPTT